MTRQRVQGFQPERLRQVLAARRLSQVQLASMVGVSPATISKWRTGTQAPEPAALQRLATVVNVAAEWFTRVPLPRLTTPLFRRNAAAHAAARAMLEARLEWAQDVTAALLEYVDYPTVNVPTRTFVHADEITSADIEDAADECRARWRLGRAAVQDIALAAEGAGVILVREETGAAQIEGLSAWSELLQRPLVLLSADKQNGYRSRFDLAHEIGHLVLHRRISAGRPLDAPQRKLLERQAHRFAGAFLLPAETFAADVRLPTTLDDLLLLKQRWGVSVAAIIMRMKALGLVDEFGAQTLFKRRSARWGAKSEPGDDARAPECPRLLRRAVELMVAENVMVRDAVVDYIGLGTPDVEALANLQDGYLHGNATVIALQLKQRQKSVPTTPNGPNVVPFRRHVGA